MDQLKYYKDFKKAGVTALLCMGASPEMTNIATAEGAKKFNEILKIKIGAEANEEKEELIRKPTGDALEIGYLPCKIVIQ
jgi:saccharopine dehydrogenase-like NADP-dependent oxidoreductase